jgi:hypothetical protein
MSLESNTRALLTERIARLDRAVVVPMEVSAAVHFVDVMASITHTQLTPSSKLETYSRVVDPLEADELVASCELLDAIAQQSRSIADGPLVAKCQEWIADGPRPGGEDVSRTPAARHFRAPDKRASIPPSTKPFHLGLYTSTMLPRAQGMWRIYLDKYGGAPVLLPRPWHCWHLRPVSTGLRVREIASARDWTAFVSTYATTDGDRLYPDWQDAADDYDAVHVAARAIVAIQGFSFPTPAGCTAPAYWDVESTFWLRWVFTGATLLDVVP